jgi:hypothetical protein
MPRLLTAAAAATLAALLHTQDCAGTPSSRATSASVPATAAPPTALPEPMPVPAVAEAPDLFASVARPVLKTRCSPCHEPGGQLYDRLPFDNPKVVSSHSEKVLRRLKGEDRQALERWLATLKPAS